jgi:integrase/recombinase XerC
MGEFDDFLRTLQLEKRYSLHTLSAYSTDLYSFYRFIQSDFPKTDMHQVENYMIRAWVLSLGEKGLKSSTINRKISSLKAYYNFLKKQNLIKNNPTQALQPLKKVKALPKFVEQVPMQSLLEDYQFGNDYKGVLDKCLINLFYATGIRLSELTNIKKSDIDFYEGNLKVLGKRNKQRIIPLHQEVILLIKEYIDLRNSTFESIDSPYLFITPSGKEIYNKYVYRRINSVLSAVTTMSKRSPHIIRHTFATHMLNAGADLNAIKEILGHASLAATQVYTHNSIEQLKSIYKQAHPKA